MLHVSKYSQSKNMAALISAIRKMKDLFFFLDRRSTFIEKNERNSSMQLHEELLGKVISARLEQV